MSEHEHTTKSNKPLAIAIVIVILAYLICAIPHPNLSLPQKGAEMIATENEHGHAAHDEGSHEPGTAHHESEGEGHGATDEPLSEEVHKIDEKLAKEGITVEEGPAYGKDKKKLTPPPFWTVIPFVLLLGAIAVLPLIPATEHWWESNKSRFLVAAGLGLITLLYYLFFHHYPIDGHFPVHTTAAPGAGGPNWAISLTVLSNAFLAEYIPFIILLFALYTISGGIRISGDLKAHALTNTTFIAIGGLLASFIGTTGAAMLLIRPLLETNKERKHVVHTVVFFIFVVCNCGGCLLPIGDPPLFLGYLRGVPFEWTFNLWIEWAFLNGVLIGLYFILDHFIYHPKELPLDVALDETRTTGLKIEGLFPNIILLVGVILAVALLDPHKTIGGWRPWVFMREIVQLLMVLLSLVFGSQMVRIKNRFNYHAILEVAALFIGIFICMQPALQILNIYGPDLGLNSPMKFFWATGSLSSVLDNAPTYVVFFDTAQSLPSMEGVKYVGDTGVPEHLLIGISLGAVFMGAMTYIGNGPNFMVKAIAEKSGVKMPSFFGYM
ncbi:MAG: sodium:proton antiporter, partial [Planctomycetia bacterium]